MAVHHVVQFAIGHPGHPFQVDYPPGESVVIPRVGESYGPNGQKYVSDVIHNMDQKGKDLVHTITVILKNKP